MNTKKKNILLMDFFLQLWKPVFDKYDRAKTGRIQISEFQRILQEGNNHLSEDIPQDVLDQLINNSNSFKDGFLTYDEFLELVFCCIFIFLNSRLKYYV